MNTTKAVVLRWHIYMHCSRQGHDIGTHTHTHTHTHTFWKKGKEVERDT